MIHLKLNVDEATVLQSILDNFYDNLRVEIRRTENRGYREMLKQQEALVKKILEALESTGMKAAA